MIRNLCYAIALAGIVSIAHAASGPMIEITSFTIDAGGGTSAGGDLEVVGTVAQPDAGVSIGGGWELTGGFHVGGAGAAPCLGDADGSGEVDVDDLVAVILDWNTDGSNNGGDVDGSGAVDVDDLVTVILNWGLCPE